MLSSDNISWLKRLSNQERIQIVPYNPRTKTIFDVERKYIRSILGNRVRIVHRGATSLKISGQVAVVFNIPFSLKDFDPYLSKLITVYGKPGSLYPTERAKFNIVRSSIPVEIILINTATDAWTKGLAFEHYLKSHPKELNAYRDLKEKCDGVDLREYYTKKLSLLIIF